VIDEDGEGCTQAESGASIEPIYITLHSIEKEKSISHIFSLHSLPKKAAKLGRLKGQVTALNLCERASFPTRQCVATR
jgi:hypothetical protein